MADSIAGKAGSGDAARRGLLSMRRLDPARRRAATPLELLFDLAFVVAFGQAADQLTHAIAAGHAVVGVGGFVYAIMAIASVWVSFTWFGSAFGIDDWAYRLATMVQMIGVVVLALGLPDLFRTLVHGDSIDARVIIAGYFVMRAATLLQWTRLAVQDRGQRRPALQHTLLLGISLAGWLAVAIIMPAIPGFVLAAGILFLVEITGTRLVERTSGQVGWNAHHIAERFGLLAIIALGEGVFGTVASVTALVENAGWSFDAITVVTAGVGLTFGLWWMYFMTPYGWILSRFRRKFQPFIYLHFALYAGIVAIGAGLHVAAYAIEGTAGIGAFAATLAVILPVAVFCLAVMAAYTYMLQEFDSLHAWLSAATTAVLALAAMVSAAGAPIGVTLLIVTAAPAVSVVGFEAAGRNHQRQTLERLAQTAWVDH